MRLVAPLGALATIAFSPLAASAQTLLPENFLDDDAAEVTVSADAQAGETVQADPRIATVQNWSLDNACLLYTSPSPRD